MPKNIKLSTAIERGRPLIREDPAFYLHREPDGSLCGCMLGMAAAYLGFDPDKNWGSGAAIRDAIGARTGLTGADQITVTLEEFQEVQPEVDQMHVVEWYAYSDSVLYVVDQLHTSGWPATSIIKLLKKRGL